MIAKAADYASFLEGLSEWSYFATITEHRARSSKSWRSGLEKCFRYTPRSYERIRPDAYFWALERHKSGAFHGHALLYYNDYRKPRAKALWSVLYDKFGRSQVVEFDKQKGGIYYVSKYVTKESIGITDWEFNAERRSIC